MADEINEQNQTDPEDWEKMLAAGGDTGATDAADIEPSKDLSQDEIDKLLGFKLPEEEDKKNRGIRAMLDKALQSYERLPMLEVVLDRFVRILSTSLRNFTYTADIDIRSISSLRFGNYINSIPMPALISVFKAIEWENFGLVTYDSHLIYSLVDILFGGKKSIRPIKVDGRPYTTIEQGVVKQLCEILLSDLSTAFDMIAPATFQFDRTESNPRFATICRPGDAAILLQLSVEMEDRGGKMEILFPYATLEPIRELLLQVFMGEKFGKDSEWEASLQAEVNNTSLELEALLKTKPAMMEDILKLKVGSTIVMDSTPDDEVMLTCKGTQLFTGKLGRVGNKMAVNVREVLSNPEREKMNDYT